MLYREFPTGSNIWQPVDSLFNIQDTTYTHFGLNTLNNVYCYRLQVVDICGFRSSLDSSRRHCTMDLTATPGVDQSLLNWTPYIGWDSVAAYDLYRVNDYDTAAVQYIGTVPGGTTSYIDSAVVCYESYCYRVRAREFGGFLETSWSDTSCATPVHIPNPLPLDVCSASVREDSVVTVSWDIANHPDAMMVFVEKSTDGQTWYQVGTFPPNVFGFTDFDVTVNVQSYWYRLAVVDSCGDISPYGRYGRTMVLEAENRNSSPNLDWNAYEEWPAGVLQYDIEVFNDLTQQWELVDRTNFSQTDYIDLLTNLDQVEYCYRIIAHEDGGTCRSTSNVACVPVGPALYVPNIFTPNGDGTNDLFVPQGIYLAQYNLRIFDRWGALIFESNSLDNQWDGRWRDKPCQEGAFVWVITGRGFDGTEIEKRGTVTLVR